MKIIDRVFQYIDYKGIKPIPFEKKIGLSNGYLGKQQKRNADLGEGIILKIVENCPEINPYWLLTGNGEMLNTKSEENVIKKNDNINDNNFDNKPKVQKMLSNKEIEKGVPIFYTEGSSYKESYTGIPLIPIDAMAGFGEGDIQVMDYETSMYKVPEFEELRTDFMIRVKGSSMYPKYSSGDTVACKKLNISDIFFQWNKVYVLSTEQGAIIKRVKKGSDDEHILLVSENPSYEPFELHLSQIYAIAIVIGVIRME
nr:MAG TPA: hypothetical protein [Caudoviricetes sp.]